MGRKMSGRPPKKFGKQKRKPEDRLKPEAYKGYNISFVKYGKLMKIRGKFVDNPIEWHVKGERGYEETKEKGLIEAKKYINKLKKK